MSKIGQELKVLLYLNQRYGRKNFVSVKEIAEYLEVSDRQARRYLEDLDHIHDIKIVTKLGRYGGYRLETPLDKGFALPENIALAISIATKRNEKIGKVLSELPNYVVTDVVEGDNQVGDHVLDNLETLITAIQNRKAVVFTYRDIDKTYLVEPYKVFYTNHTYYLKAVHEDILKNLDISEISNLKQLSSFKYNKNRKKECDDLLKKYGVSNGKTSILRVKCVDEVALKTFDKYFEGMGTKDLTNLTYTVVGSDEHELYYPLFRISTKSYEFIDEEFKSKYIEYLENQIRSIRDERKN